MTRDNQRLSVVMVYAAMFFFYLATLLFYVMPMMVADPTRGDIFSSLGLGAVLGWFLKQLGDMGQFYVRKGTIQLEPDQDNREPKQ